VVCHVHVKHTFAVVGQPKGQGPPRRRVLGPPASCVLRRRTCKCTCQGVHGKGVAAFLLLPKFFRKARSVKSDSSRCKPFSEGLGLPLTLARSSTTTRGGGRWFSEYSYRCPRNSVHYCGPELFERMNPTPPLALRTRSRRISGPASTQSACLAYGSMPSTMASYAKGRRFSGSRRR